MRQTSYDPLIRTIPGLAGRRTVDAWTSLAGRVVNGDARLGFQVTTVRRSRSTEPYRQFSHQS